jgi:hypothetical protein
LLSNFQIIHGFIQVTIILKYYYYFEKVIDVLFNRLEIYLTGLVRFIDKLFKEKLGGRLRVASATDSFGLCPQKFNKKNEIFIVWLLGDL